MGQQNDSNRNASLDEKKERASGRQNEHPRNAPQSMDEVNDVGGAFGNGKQVDKANNLSKGGGGGGAGPAMADDKLRHGAYEDDPQQDNPDSKAD